MPALARRNLPYRLIALACLALPPQAFGQAAAVEAELSQKLVADQLLPDAPLLLKVRTPWQVGDCRLASGALLHATVRSVSRTPKGHTQAFTLTVRAACEDKEQLDLVITSLLAPPKVELISEQFPGYSSFGGAQSVRTAAPLSFNAAAALRSVPRAVRTTAVETNKLPPSVTLGEVWRLPDFRLVLPTGGSTLSTITTVGTKATLPINTVVILQTLRSETHPLRTVPLLTEQPHPAAQSAPVMAPFVGPCHAGSCTPYPATLALAAFGFERAGKTTDLSPLGFRPEHDREVSGLDLAVTVHFLADTQLLITFPTHELVRRSSDDRPTDEPRAVRAVLFNTETGSVESVRNWIIDDHKDYVWPLGNHLLVHQGHTLRVYGRGLEELANLPLPLPLASLRASPDGKHLLVGELHELHSKADHQLLVESEPRGPKEEVSWSLLDGDLKPLKKLGSSSNFVPTPVLLNGSMIQLRRGPEPEWSLLGKTWDSDAETQLGTLRSTCLPVLDNLAPDLMTLTTCKGSGSGLHTAIVRENGTPVIEQTSNPHDLPVSFAASSDSSRVALLLSHADDNYTNGFLFRLSTIRSQNIEVLGTDTGSLLATIPLPEAAHYSHAFALSPDGGTLALVSDHTLTLYALHPQPAQPQSSTALAQSPPHK